MGWESEQETPVEPKSRIVWIWALVALIFIVTTGMSFMQSGETRIQISRAHVRHILIKYDTKNNEEKEQALSQINDIRTWIKEGQDFKKLAKQYSHDQQSKPKGGDLGWVTRGLLVEDIDAFIWTAKIDEVSDVIPTSFGFHLVQVLEREISESEQYNLDLNQRINERNEPE